jgi:DNA-binding IclR family transcriptional regulator
MRNENDGDVAVAEPRDRSVIGAVDRAMQLLTLLTERGELGVSEAARELGTAPSTVARLLSTMAGRGFVEQTDSRRYRPRRMLGAAGPSRPESRAANLVATLRPLMRELYDEIGETVHLMVLAGSDIQFIDGIEGTQPLRIGLRIGARMPAYTTSGGKAILAEFDDTLVDTILGGELHPWASTRTTRLEQFHTELAEIRQAGVAVNLGESERGVQALGVAVGPAPRHPAAAITVSVPSERLGAEQRRRIIAALRRARGRAQTLLG